MCPTCRRRQRPARAWNERRVLIFTENREGTKRWLERRSSREAIARHRPRRGAHRRDHRPHGRGQPQGGPAALQRRPGQATRCASCIATDAAREGLNFQAHCADLFHFDLPWNPGRMSSATAASTASCSRPTRSAATTSSRPARRGPRSRRPGPQDRDDQEGARQPLTGHRRRASSGGCEAGSAIATQARSPSDRRRRPRRAAQARRRGGARGCARAPGRAARADRALRGSARALAHVGGV